MKVSDRIRIGVTLALAGGLLAFSAVTAPAQDAKQLYEKNCLSCHGATGKADGPAAKMIKPPPQDFAVSLKPMSDADIFKSIKEGGLAVGKAKSMPGYAAKLKDDQIQAIIAYIKSLL